jgi:hypothetical protein
MLRQHGKGDMPCPGAKDRLGLDGQAGLDEGGHLDQSGAREVAFEELRPGLPDFALVLDVGEVETER